ncbi:MAG TPA: N-acetyltransferase [Nitrososphaerales archaeon]|nr:N-acetyltransferase [Nitrososphaerales archaeon]
MQKAAITRVGDYAIRRCDNEDVPKVIDINTKTLPEHYSDYFYYEILAESPETFLLAETEGALVGYIMCRVEYGFSQLKRLGLARKGHVVSIAVLDEHRGRGLGTALMTTAQQELVKKGCSECYLEVRVSNEGAIELYKRLDYKVMGTLDAYYRDGEPAFMMATRLGS